VLLWAFVACYGANVTLTNIYLKGGCDHVVDYPLDL
jgi:hypothetical protein